MIVKVARGDDLSSSNSEDLNVGDHELPSCRRRMTMVIVLGHDDFGLRGFENSAIDDAQPERRACGGGEVRADCLAPFEAKRRRFREWLLDNGIVGVEVRQRHPFATVHMIEKALDERAGCVRFRHGVRGETTAIAGAI